MEKTKALRLERFEFLGGGAVGGYDGEIYAAAHVVVAGDAHPFRVAGGDHRVEDVVGDIFVEGALVAKAPQILLDGFGFEAPWPGAVFDLDLGEVGLAGERAEGGELVRREGDGVGVVGVGVGKRL